MSALDDLHQSLQFIAAAAPKARGVWVRHRTVAMHVALQNLFAQTPDATPRDREVFALIASGVVDGEALSRALGITYARTLQIIAKMERKRILARDENWRLTMALTGEAFTDGRMIAKRRQQPRRR